jgi:hypothetical protein
MLAPLAKRQLEAGRPWKIAAALAVALVHGLGAIT